MLQVKTIRPGRSAMRTPTPQTVLSLPIVTPEKAVLLATTTNDGENQLSRIGADTSLLNKKDPSSKAAGKEEQTGMMSSVAYLERQRLSYKAESKAKS